MFDQGMQTDHLNSKFLMLHQEELCNSAIQNVRVVAIKKFKTFLTNVSISVDDVNILDKT
jgi:chromosomal replication initiation ATPase DnaA